MTKCDFKEKNAIILLVLLSIADSLAILLFGAASIPLFFLSAFILYIFFNLKNSIILALGITPMMNIGVFHIGIVDIRISQLLWAPILIVALINKAFYSGMNRTKLDPRIRMILIILIGSSFLSIIPSDYPFISLRESLQLVYLTAIFIIIVVEVNSIQMLNKAIIVLLFSSLVFIIFGFLKIILGYSIMPFIEINGLHSISFIKTPLVEQAAFTAGALFKRADAFFLGPVGTAAYLIPIIILAISLLYDKNSLTSTVRRTCCFCSLLGSFLLLLTFSRAGLVILLLLLLLLSFLKRCISKELLIIFICIFLIFIISVSQRARLLEITSLGEESTQEHLRLWKQAIVMFINKPMLGYGAGTFCFQKYFINVPYFLSGKSIENLPHNMFLLMAAETGFIGLISLTLFLFMVIRNIWINLRREKIGYLYNINLGLLLGITGVILMNLTMNFFAVEIFWMLLALGYATSNITKNKSCKI
jgi:O-antigen ligase